MNRSLKRSKEQRTYDAEHDGDEHSKTNLPEMFLAEQESVAGLSITSRVHYYIAVFSSKQQAYR